MSQQPNMHEFYLKKALELAKEREGFCAPNPSVGAVVVENDQIKGIGNNWGSGHPHAEVMALKEIDEAPNATIYVTLEPCCHWGKTPPCTDLLIEKKIKRVYFAFEDPNPKVKGKGKEALEATGIEVIHHPLEAIDQFYRPYAHWHQTGKPYTVAKMAMSLDGKIAGPGKTQLQISDHALHQFTHQQRKRADGILTTINTVQADNPALNVRQGEHVIAKPLFILDSTLQLALDSRLFTTAESITVFHAPHANSNHALSDRAKRLEKAGVTLVETPYQDGLCLETVMREIGQRSCHFLWVETGGLCFKNLSSQSLLNQAYLYISPKWLGADHHSAIDDAHVLENASQIQWYHIGHDGVCEVHWNNTSEK